MEQHYEAVFNNYAADDEGQIRRLLVILSMGGTSRACREDAERLSRLLADRQRLEELRAAMRHAATRAAACQERAGAEQGTVLVASDEANHPRLVTLDELGEWFRDVGDAGRVFVYRQAEGGTLEALTVKTVSVAHDDLFTYHTTELQLPDTEVVASIEWDMRR